MTVVLAAGATTVWLLSRSQINRRLGTVVNEEIDELPTKELEAALEEEEETDPLTAYWAGSIPEGTCFLLSISAAPSSHHFPTFLSPIANGISCLLAAT